MIGFYLFLKLLKLKFKKKKTREKFIIMYNISFYNKNKYNNCIL